MRKKQPVYSGLDTVPVYYTDTSELSPELFVITEFPTKLTAGKNILKLRGNSNNLRVDATLNIEILDSNNEPIYYESTSYVEEDWSRVISIYIYPDTPPGDAFIILTSEASQIFGQPVPTEWKNAYNVKWVRKSLVNPTLPNSSEILFETLPDVTIQEYSGVQLDRIYATTQNPIYTNGKVSYQNKSSRPILLISGGAFVRDMVDGTVTVSSPVNPSPLPYYNYTLPVYTSKIKKVLSDTAILLQTPYIFASSQSLIPHQFDQFDDSVYSIEYTASPTYSATENSESFALVKIDNLEPATGDISRIKVFINNTGTVGTWEQVSDIELEETEIFVTSTASLTPDISIGFIKSQNVIDTYYTASAYNGKTFLGNNTITYNTLNLNNSMYVTSVNNSVTVLKSKDLYKGTFLKGSKYKVTLDALSVGTDAKISVYLSGSAFNTDLTDRYNQELPITAGRKIGELESSKIGNRIDDYVLPFSADNDGTAVLLFIIQKGNWYISDIRTTSDNDPGYTPNYTRIRTLIPTSHKANVQLNFKVEYYNIAGSKSKQVNYINNVPWLGGNRYIDGEYSLLTGSLYVADTLKSGIGISGYSDTGFIRSLGYSGFDAGYPGFLLYSGSALGGALSKGIPYSGVGLELYASTSSYFRYSTRDNELDIRTDKMYIGNNNTFISASNGKLQISSSNFTIDANGAVSLTGTVNISSGTGFATPDSVTSLSSSLSSSISSTSSSLSGTITTTSSSLSGTITSNSSSISSSLAAASSSLAGTITTTSSSLNSKITSVSSSLSSSLASASSSLAGTITSNSSSAAIAIQATSDRIVTDANNKITKTNNTPIGGPGLFLSSNYLGYYSGGSWNAYMSASGDFLFQKDANNLISFGNNAFILKVSDQATISGSNINLLTPRFFFGGANQYISGSDGKIAISSSNFYLDNAGNVTLTGVVNIQAGSSGVATPASVTASLNAVSSSLSSSLASASSSLAGTITSNSSSLSSSLAAASSSINTKITSVSSSLSSSLASASSSLAGTITSNSSSLSGTITSNSQSAATSFTTAFGRIVTDANNKITKTNDAPGGAGLFLSSNYLGYYNSPNWNSYISSSGEFLFQKDANNLISFGNNAFTLKVSDTATISGSNINLITPNFFFGGVNQYISGSGNNIAISSSNFHLASNGDVIVSGVINIRPGSSGVATPASVSASLNAVSSSLSSSLASASSSLAGTITSNSSSLSSTITSNSSSLSSSLAAASSSLAGTITTTSSSLNTKITSVSSSLSSSLASVSSSLSSSVSSVSSSLLLTSSSLSTTITSNSSSAAARIITDANNKIIKVNDIPLGAGLNLTANYLGYYRTTAPAGWNAYISASGEFLFKKDDNNLMSLGNNSMILKVSDTVFMSGSSISLITPNFFFGGANQYISGSGNTIAISSSNFHLASNGDVIVSGVINIKPGSSGVATPASVTASLSAVSSSLSSSLAAASSSLAGTITSNSSSLSSTITSTSSSLSSTITSNSSSISSSLAAASSSLNTKITSVSSSLTGTITSNSQSSATSFATAFGRIVTDANNKIIKTNDVPSAGTGLYLSSNYLGYYNNSLTTIPNPAYSSAIAIEFNYWVYTEGYSPWDPAPSGWPYDPSLWPYFVDQFIDVPISQWNSYISSSGEFKFEKDANNLISFGNNSLILKVSDQATLSGSNINLITPNFFFGNANTFISGSGGNIQISSSNFSVRANGSVTASNIDISGVAQASIIRNKSVTITTANSSSYLQLVPAVDNDSGGLLTFVPSYYVLCLDGSLGGEKIQRVLITCDFPNAYSIPRTSFYPLAIGGIKLPSIITGQSAMATIEVNASNVVIRDDIGTIGTVTPGVPPIWRNPPQFE